MVPKTVNALSHLLPARLGLGSNHRPDPATRTRNQEKHPKEMLVLHDRLGDPELDPFRGNSPSMHRPTDPGPRRDRPDLFHAPSDSLPPPLLIPNGGVRESPTLLHRVRTKRSSFTNFFAFSSKRRSSQVPLAQLQTDFLVPPQAISGKWVPGSGQTQVHLVNAASIPSPLRADEEEYYYSYYPPSHPATPNPGSTDRSPSKQLSWRQQDIIGHPGLDSQLSSPVDSHPAHTQIRHPYAYSTPLYSKPPPLRHVASQPLQHHPQDSRSGVHAGFAYASSHHGHDASKSHSHFLQPEIKTSMSTPNLATGTSHVRHRSFLRKKPTRSKAQERWLSAESWWDALFSPSPRFKIKQAPRPNPLTEHVVHHSVSPPPPAEPNRNMTVTFPSIQATRPRALSATSPASSSKPVPPSLTRSQSALELNGQPSTSAIPRPGFLPALETLTDTPTPPPDLAPPSDPELPLPDPPLSLAQVLDEVQAFEQQRAQWKHQAARSLGNKHTRSFSRARSKSLGERHVRLGRHTSESSKAHLNLEFLAARTLLGSQSMMPVVHVTKPSSTHSKAHSYSHSQSAHSHSHSSYSRAYSHSHSHSLTTSHSSKSSRHLPPRGHSRTGSWSKTAFLKAGSLCGIGQDDSHMVPADEIVPSSSRGDVQGVVLHIGDVTRPEYVSNADKVSRTPSGEVGIAISSSPLLEDCFDPSVSASRHQESDQESRWSSRHTHKSSEYAGPHRSVIDCHLPQLGVASDVSLRHRLPPRAAIAPIPHPYRSATVQSDQVGNKRGEAATLKVTEGQEAMEPDTRCSPHPHLSLSHADFERYGVGEALVYASCPRPEVPEAKQADVQSESLPATESPPRQEHSPSCETVVLPPEERDSSSLGMDSIPSLTHSTIQMVMSAFDNPDDLDEFQDLFYKPHPTPGGQQLEPGATIDQVPADIDDSTPSSPLTHLVRKLSEEVKSLRNPSRTPSDSISLQRSESQDQRSNEDGTRFVFMDMARPSSSPPPMESSSQVHVTIQQECCGTIAQRVTVIPEDVHSSYTSSILDSPSDDPENDTFGYPVKHGQLEAVTAPTPVQTTLRISTHLSIQENEDDEDEDDTAFLSPVTKRFGLASVDAVRASYVTTSDISRMSGLSDFPLPPGMRPLSILQAYFDATPVSPTSQSYSYSDDETEMRRAGRPTGGEGGEEDEEEPGDVGETLRALRTTPRVTSYESRRSTFGGSDSDDVDYITQLHQACP